MCGCIRIRSRSRTLWFGVVECRIVSHVDLSMFKMETCNGYDLIYRKYDVFILISISGDDAKSKLSPFGSFIRTEKSFGGARQECYAHNFRTFKLQVNDFYKEFRFN